MHCSRFYPPVDLGRSAFSGFRFPPEVIMLAVRWYLRYRLSCRDLEELLAERGIDVDHVTLFRWVQRFTPLLVDAARPCRHAASGRWFVDETYVKVSGIWRYVYRAVRQQPGRMRPRAAQSPPPTHARNQDRRLSQSRHRGPRVRAEPPTRPLRTRRRSRPALASP
jgi:hypothetical protein